LNNAAFSFPSCDYPLKLDPLFQERVWGREDLDFLYPARADRPRLVGEAWLTGDQNRVANGIYAGKSLAEAAKAAGSVFPLLVKFLFTSQKLSVQVHPQDAYARRHEQSFGKTEMWHVLRADLDATLAIGFRQDMVSEFSQDKNALRSAVENGEIEQMLDWISVKAGDTFFVPAGTVHAIGPGLVICEIQQNSDITYRLYDYHRHGADGKLRPLHVDKALDVLDRQQRGGKTTPLELQQKPYLRNLLTACPYFVTERVVIEKPFPYKASANGEIWVGLEGELDFETEKDSVSCVKGEVVVLPAGLETITIHPKWQSVFLRTYPPRQGSNLLEEFQTMGWSEKELSRVCFPMEDRSEG